jgi:diguanylate cyclase (GGDEF)-like protein/PAS domain S-box-containing protein
VTAGPELRARAAAVQHSAADLSRALVEATDSLICVVDRDGAILLANAALARFTGLAATDLLGRCLWEVLVTPDEVHLARTALAAAFAGGHLIPGEVDWRAASGTRRVALDNSVLTDDDGRPYATAFVGTDVTEDRAREELSHLRATTDPLTGLGNRRVVFDALQRQLAPAGGGCGVLFCDVDLFKTVNDRYGHAVGDQVLVEIAARLAALSGVGDVVARLGGDEFLLLTPGADGDALTALARRVAAAVREPVQTTAGPLQVGVSIGSAVGLPGADPDELMARADRDMYGRKTRRPGNRTRTPGAVPGRG